MPPHYRFGRFLLAQAVTDQAGRLRLRLADGQECDTSKLAELHPFPGAAAAMESVRGLLEEPIAGRWLWIQLRLSGEVGGADSVWIWDASLPPPADYFELDDETGQLAEAERRLVCWTKLAGTGWQAAAGPSLKVRRAPSREDRIDAALRQLKGGTRTAATRGASDPGGGLRHHISLLSSFSAAAAAGQEGFVAHWPGAIAQCELYQPVDALLGSDGNGAALPSVAEMRASARARADDIVRKCQGTGIKSVRAIASFVPGLAQDPGTPSARQAVLGLGFLVHLARALRSHRHRVEVVEFVTGSRTKLARRMQAQTTDPQQVLFMELHHPDEAVANLCANLSRLVRETELQPDESIRLAAELEPGVLFAVRDRPTLRQFADGCRADPHLAPLVGINVDVGHFALAGVTTDWIRETPEVMSRIVHFHVSDHYIGHIADLELETFGLGRGDAGFDDWCRLYWDVNSQHNRRLLRPSGLISLEYEAVASVDVVERSFRKLQKLLGRTRPATYA